MNKVRAERLKKVSKVKKIALIVVGAIFLIGLVGTCVSGTTAKAGEPVEIIAARDRTSKTYDLGGGKYGLDVSIESVHYEDDYGDWQNIETDILPSDKPAWDYEVVKGHWHLLINNDTTVAVGKGGNWIGFKYVAFGYLDWSTKDYYILQTRQAVTPVVEGNSITWSDIFYGADLEYIYTPDGFKENLHISQDTRDYLTANPPSAYGLDNDTSYLVGVIECDWQLQTFTPEDALGRVINWDNAEEFINSGVYWRDTVSGKIVTALPIGIAYSADPAADDYVDLRYRFYKDGDTHYLLFGAKVLDLNALPIGTIVIDPSVDEEVDASADDAYEEESTGAVSINSYSTLYEAGSQASYRTYGGLRWESGSFPATGATIDVCYCQIYVYNAGWDDINSDFYFQDGTAAPAQFTTDTYDISGRTPTSTEITWAEDSLGVGYATSPSLVDTLQDLVDGYSPTALVLIGHGNGGGIKQCWTDAYDKGSTYYGLLHIEYTAGGCSPSIELNLSSWSVNSGNPVDEDSNYTTGLSYFTVTNHSGGTVTITIGGGDMIGGGYTWDLSDDGSNGDMVYGMYAGLSGGSYNIVVKESEPYNTLKSGLADEGTQDFGLSIYTPTNFDDGNAKSGAMTLTAVCD